MFARNGDARGGFTVVELMIAIAIMGIVASIAVPNYAKYKEKIVDSEAISLHQAAFKGEAAYWHIEQFNEGVAGGARGHCLVTCRMRVGASAGQKGVKYPHPDDEQRCAAIGQGLDAPSKLYHDIASGYLPAGIKCWPTLKNVNNIRAHTNYVSYVNSGKVAFWVQAIKIRDGELMRGTRSKGSRPLN